MKFNIHAVKAARHVHQISPTRIDRVSQMDPHGSSHRRLLTAATRELASAINLGSHAVALTVGRKGDCKGSLVTEHCVTQVYYATLRVLPTSHSFPCHVKNIHAFPLAHRRFVRSLREHRDPPGDNQERTRSFLSLSIAPQFSLRKIQFVQQACCLFFFRFQYSNL